MPSNVQVVLDTGLRAARIVDPYSRGRARIAVVNYRRRDRRPDTQLGVRIDRVSRKRVRTRTQLASTPVP